MWDSAGNHRSILCLLRAGRLVRGVHFVVLVLLSAAGLMSTSVFGRHAQQTPPHQSGLGGLGDCCVPNNGSAGCNDASCEQMVCDRNSFCCQTNWDGACADLAVDLCPGRCTNGDHDCCISKSTPGCSNLTCEQMVCSMDGFCCSGTWDATCAERAWEHCGPVCHVVGDCVVDFIVDLNDYADFRSCLTGTNGGPVDGHCRCADLDADGDADAVDWSVLQTLLSQ